MTPPSTRTPESSSQGARTLWHAANQDLLREGYFERSELRSDFAAAPFAGCDLFGATVQISPIESVKRHSKEQYGIVTESIYAPARSRIEICYEAPAHLLVLYEDGVRREGETSIDGLSPSGLRNFANKLTFVPAGHAYREWHETGTALRITYLYLSPTKLQKSIDADTSYAPRTFFEDPILWATATKLKNVIERNQPESKLYFDVSRHACSARSAKPASFLSSLQAILWNSTAGTSSSAAHGAGEGAVVGSSEFDHGCRIDSRLRL